MKKKNQSVTPGEVRKDQADKIKKGTMIDDLYKNSSGKHWSKGKMETFSHISWSLREVL
ncbi:MAG TPA: hypothetical protein PK200_11310 [Spirochaetota bacterium]|nr:hypothetical protein [Spirochaetota bacterium]HQO02382.1 hypothetical protein [Spirochaetota bacterium]